jgi:excinuclease ABC subunit C
MIPAFLDKSKLPHKPGVYIFKDASGGVLYVGKAIDLYHRVASYFSKGPGSRKFTGSIATVETIIVESELEALILEANLIKKFLPPFNVRLTDDKDYLYIVLTKEDFPRVLTARKNTLKQFQKYWGPFPSSRTVKETLKSLRRVFPWCANPANPKKRPGFLDPTQGRIAKTRQRPCFYYHLKQCPGACVGLISGEEYQGIIKRFSKFLDGKKEELVSELLKEIDKASKESMFEEAGRVKKTLDGVLYLTQANRTRLYLENPNFLEEERQLALVQLQKDLNLKKLPERIEGYDISNISGKEASGSMVVLTDGEIDKSQYRKFKIQITGKPNDVAMHREMLKRRLRHPEWSMPGLILIDGGRGQVRGAKLELEDAKLEIPVYGLAKRLEWLYPPEGEIIKLSKRSLSLKLLQKLRDEAHRFAVSYHRKLRGNIFLR